MRPPSLRLVLAGVLLLALFTVGGIDLRTVAVTVMSAEPLTLAAAVAVYTLGGTLLRSVKWQYLVAAKGHALSTRHATAFTLVAIYTNQLLPTAVGGDIARSLLLARQGVERPVAFGSAFVDRVLSVGALVLLALAFAAAAPIALPRALESAGRVLIGCVLVVATAAWMSSRSSTRSPRTSNLGRRIRGSRLWSPVSGVLVRPILRQTLMGLGAYRGGTLAVALGIGIAQAIVLVLATLLLAAALGQPIGAPGQWLFAVPLGNLYGLVPTLGGWGVREWSFVGLYRLLSPPVSASIAASIGLLFGAMNLALGVVGGVVAARYR